MSDFLSILIVSYNTKDLLRKCLRSVDVSCVGIKHEVIIIDNQSDDGSADMVERDFPHVRLIKSSSNDGYGVAINIGVKEAKGNWLMFLNPDIEVMDGAVSALLGFAKSRPEPTLVGPRLVYGNGEPQPSARRFLSAGLLLAEASRLHLLLPAELRGRMFLGTYFPQNKLMNVPWVSGACHLLPKSLWDDVGPLTEETFCGSDDYDYCYRVRKKGYQVWFCPDSKMIHHCSVSVKRRWSSWEVEQVAIHNFYVILESHWPSWRVKAFCFAEMISFFSEWLRNFIKPRLGWKESDESYSYRLKRRFLLNLDFLIGRQKPVRRFQPAGRQKSQLCV